MEAFKISSRLNELNSTYPDAITINKISKEGSEEDRIAIARLWLSEGIPYAFKNYPGLYETIRTWLASRLSIHAKDISITGSARLGSSLNPKQLGKTFNENSDLDFFIISEKIFNNLKTDFNKWSSDYEEGLIIPSNVEKEFWKDNLTRGIKLFDRGFFDPHLIPNRESYPEVQNISQTMYLLKRKLEETINAPKISKVSIRCYKNWSDYVRQVSINLFNN